MRISLRLKIMGLFLVTFVALIFIVVFLTVRQNKQSNIVRNNAIRQADNIALLGTIERHNRTLDKTATNLLNTDELLTFFTDQKGANSRMVLEGMFLSFQEEGIVRFSLYSADGLQLFEQSKDRPKRQPRPRKWAKVKYLRINSLLPIRNLIGEFLSGMLRKL